MSDRMAFPVQDIGHLIIEEMARDAQVWGVADASEITVTFPSGAPALLPEADAAHLSGAAVQRVTLPAGITVTVKRANGDLQMRGLAAEVNTEAVYGDLRLSELGGVARIARIDGDLRAEDVAEIRLLGACAGDVRVEGCGNVSAEAVAGDVRLADVGAVRISRINGDLWGERLAGLQVDRVSGDARLAEVSGPVILQTLNGDLRAYDLTGGLQAPQVRGDADVQGPFSSDQAYALVADGDVSIHLTANTDARLVARAGGRVRSDVQLAPSGDGTPTFTATLGQGLGRINVSSRGDLRIVQPGAAPSGSASAGPRIAVDLSGTVTPEDLRGLGDRIRQQVAASLAAAGVTVDSGHGGWGHRSGRVGRGAPPAAPSRPGAPAGSMPPAPPPHPSRAKTTGEDEMRILKMVEDGVISAAQAERLLKALGG